MEIMELISFLKNKRVFITGHTGFKGSWLSYWLHIMGADVYGYSLEPETTPNLFSLIDLENKVSSHIADIREEKTLKKAIKSYKPDLIFHLAAQPLVRRSYREPKLTWETNVTGIINLLEACKQITHNCSVVVITTDKVYENKEWIYAYRENDPLGGYDPYSSSKAAAELVVSSWRQSFFSSNTKVKIASARAGNVIGGGDWSEDRLMPDIIKNILNKELIPIRSPQAVRPWQHVLEPLYGYLQLAKLLFETTNKDYQSAFNFGPDHESFKTVRELLSECNKWLPVDWSDESKGSHPHEAGTLTLATDKAKNILQWLPKWSFKTSIQKTMLWYKDLNEGVSAELLIKRDIEAYLQ